MLCRARRQPSLRSCIEACRPSRRRVSVALVTQCSDASPFARSHDKTGFNIIRFNQCLQGIWIIMIMFVHAEGMDGAGAQDNGHTKAGIWTQEE